MMASEHGDVIRPPFKAELYLTLMQSNVKCDNPLFDTVTGSVHVLEV